MLTIAQITALLSLLIAFGVETVTVNNVRAILTKTQATTTPISTVQTITTPIVENAPVYFGSTPVIINNPPVNNPAPTPEPVVESVPVDKSEIVIQSATKDGGGMLFYVSKLDSEGNSIKFATITMESDQGTMDAVAHSRWTYHTDPWIAGFTYYPTTAGEKTITFTAGNLTKTTTVTF